MKKKKYPHGKAFHIANKRAQTTIFKHKKRNRNKRGESLDDFMPVDYAEELLHGKFGLCNYTKRIT